ncbi:hypothetical protein B0H13DRAFT_2504091 [Mycena leptocephala]|nr:hypothetical protein B0H13DRAFT_2504091 [Mycena leptocephala]
MNPATVNRPCLVCGRPTSQWCSRCRAAFYCSPGHMQNDWPRHRERCRAAAPYVSNMVAAPPPAELEYISVSAILFLADEDQPRIITVKCRPPHYPARNLCPIPQLQPYFDTPPDSIVLTQGPSGELLRSPLHVFYSPAALTKGAPISRSIHHLTSGGAAKPWYGNIVAFKLSGPRRQGYIEAGSSDLPALSAYFLSYQ